MGGARLRRRLRSTTSPGIGVDAIVRYRQPLLQELQTRLPPLGFSPLTPPDSQSPIVAFACKDAPETLRGPPACRRYFGFPFYEHRIRVSPSVYNTMDDVEASGKDTLSDLRHAKDCSESGRGTSTRPRLSACGRPQADLHWSAASSRAGQTASNV